jgi:mRNA-degrading endonuclease RelE of RelBE toxin-antitoxin system
MEFIETPTFTKIINALLTDEEYRAFQNDLLERPEAGTRIPGASGMRKIRAALGTHGKRGGFRVWYFYFQDQNTILLVYALPKNKGSDLTKKMERQLAEAVRREMP